VQHPSSAGCTQPGLVRLTDINVILLQAEDKMHCTQATRSDGVSSSTLPSLCASKLYVHLMALSLHINRTWAQKTYGCTAGSVLQPLRLQPLQALPVTLCCNLTFASMPFLTSAVRNDATSSESGVGHAHPSKRRRSMLTVFHPSAHLRQGGTSSEC
jgi:hypothetical protein